MHMNMNLKNNNNNVEDINDHLAKLTLILPPNYYSPHLAIWCSALSYLFK